MRWGTEWPTFNMVMQGKYFFMNNGIYFLSRGWRTWYSLTNFEDHIWIVRLSYFLDPNMYGFQCICRVLWPPLILNSSGQLTELIVISFHPSRSVLAPNPINQTVLTLYVRGPSYLGLTRSISWLLMPRLLTSPGHQQPWYWICRIRRSWSYLRKDFKYLCHINVE